MKWYRRMEEIQQRTELEREEQAWFLRSTGKHMSLECRIPSYYLDLLTGNAAYDKPIRRQCIPSEKEYIHRPWELGDPLGEQAFSPVPRLIHRYERRALFLATDECFLYCRHCFRRRFTSRGYSSASSEDIQKAASYVQQHPEIRELLISGGDPLTLEDTFLRQMISVFRGVSRSLVLRICTRAPVVYPDRITEAAADMLASYQPIYIITQYNHIRECTPESLERAALLSDRGLMLMNQTVLLRGVNDQADALQELFETLTAHRILPYYLLQGDLAAGTSHLRVPLRQAISLVREVKKRLSGISMPKFAVDLPGGGGKILLLETFPVKKEPTRWAFPNGEGNLYWYPLEEDLG